MGDRVVIRPARHGDEDALARIFLDSARHHTSLDPAFYRVPSEAAVAEDAQERIGAADAEHAVLVAEVDGDVVGAIDLEIRRPPSDASMIRPVPTATVGIAVRDDHRGSGVGRHLMAAAESWARERGASRLMLDMHAGNDGARRFYERLGYAVTGLLLAKALTAKGPDGERPEGHPHGRGARGRWRGGDASAATSARQGSPPASPDTPCR